MFKARIGTARILSLDESKKSRITNDGRLRVFMIIDPVAAHAAGAQTINAYVAPNTYSYSSILDGVARQSDISENTSVKIFENISLTKAYELTFAGASQKAVIAALQDVSKPLSVAFATQIGAGTAQAVFAALPTVSYVTIESQLDQKEKQIAKKIARELDFIQPGMRQLFYTKNSLEEIIEDELEGLTKTIAELFDSNIAYTDARHFMFPIEAGFQSLSKRAKTKAGNSLRSLSSSVMSFRSANRSGNDTDLRGKKRYVLSKIKSNASGLAELYKSFLSYNPTTAFGLYKVSKKQARVQISIDIDLTRAVTQSDVLHVELKDKNGIILQRFSAPLAPLGGTLQYDNTPFRAPILRGKFDRQEHKVFCTVKQTDQNADKIVIFAKQDRSKFMKEFTINCAPGETAEFFLDIRESRLSMTVRAVSLTKEGFLSQAFDDTIIPVLPHKKLNRAPGRNRKVPGIRLRKTVTGDNGKFFVHIKTFPVLQNGADITLFDRLRLRRYSASSDINNVSLGFVPPADNQASVYETKPGGAFFDADVQPGSYVYAIDAYDDESGQYFKNITTIKVLITDDFQNTEQQQSEPFGPGVKIEKTTLDVKSGEALIAIKMLITPPKGYKVDVDLSKATLIFMLKNLDDVSLDISEYITNAEIQDSQSGKVVLTLAIPTSKLPKNLSAALKKKEAASFEGATIAFDFESTKTVDQSSSVEFVRITKNIARVVGSDVPEEATSAPSTATSRRR